MTFAEFAGSSVFVVGLGIGLFWALDRLVEAVKASRLTEAARRPLRAVFGLLTGRREGSCSRFCGCVPDDRTARHRPNPETAVYFPTCAATGRPLEECDCLDGKDIL